MDFLCLSGASWFHSEDLEYDAMATMVPRRDLLKVVRVHQVEKDAILVCYGNLMQVVTLQAPAGSSSAGNNCDYRNESNQV